MSLVIFFKSHLTSNALRVAVRAMLVCLLLPFPRERACLIAASPATPPPLRAMAVPAVFVFGDSTVDPGNNNHLTTVAKCNFPPYGRDFVGGVPTGRYSNGRVPSDMIAEAFGVKQLLPAYLDPKLGLQDLLTGVSFASGAAGYDPLTAKYTLVLSLSDQLALFKDYIGKLKSRVDEERVATIVSQSIHIVSTGSNDISNTYFLTSFRRPMYNISSYTDLMVDSASNFFRELYELGARRIGVVSLPPIGCLPSQRTLYGGLKRQCFLSANEAAVLFNAKLRSEMTSLNEKLTGARLVFLDIYYPLLDIIRHPADYGFEVASRGCCGTGNIEVSYLCKPAGVIPAGTCANDTKYVFWDSFHPTERAYQVLIDDICRKSAIDFFL